MPEGKGYDHSYIDALRDIQAGEEILGDYEKSIPYPKDSWVAKIYEQYHPEREAAVESCKKWWYKFIVTDFVVGQPLLFLNWKQLYTRTHKTQLAK